MYATLGLLWFFITNRMLASANWGERARYLIQNYKGVPFVLVSGIVLAVTLLRLLRDLEEDKTRLNQAQKARNELESRLLTMGRLANVGLVVLSHEHRYLYANDTYKEMLGLGPGELVGRHLSEVLGAAYEERARPLVERALRGETVEYELAVSSPRDANSRRIYHVTYESGTDGTAEPLTVVVISEITEHYKAAEALRARLELQETYAKVAETLPGVVYSMRIGPDGSMSVPYASPALEEFFGVKPEDLMASASFLATAVHPEDITRLAETIQASAKDLTLWLQEFRYRHPRKGFVWMVGRAIPRRESDGSTLWNGFATDVTFRKDSEATLVLQKTILEETGRIAKVGGWSYEVATGKGFWTDEVARIHDLDPGTQISKELGLGYYTEQSRPLIAAAVSDAITQGKPYDLELEIVSAAGVHKWVRTIAHPVKVDGKVVRVNGSFQDISELKRMAVARERQQRRVALLAEVSRRLVISDTLGAALKGIFAEIASELKVDVYANYMVAPSRDRLVLESSGGLTEEQIRAFAEIRFGESLCGVVAQTEAPLDIRDLSESQLPQAAGIRALGLLAYAGQPLIAHSRLIGTISFGSREKERFTEEDFRLMKAVADQIAAAVERSRLLDALREGEERFREVVESIQEVFWMTDVSHSRLVYVSPGFQTIWGRSNSSVMESMDVWRDSLHPEDRHRVLVDGRAKELAGPHQKIYRILRPDETIRWVRDRSFPVRDASGQVIRLVGVAEDITEQRQLEEKFMRAQRMEALGTLASGIAHDLNNILSPMLMVGALFRDKLQAAEDQALLDMVERSARRGARIVGQLLAFGRGLDGTKVVLQPRHIIKEVYSLMQETLPRSIEVSVRVPTDLWNVSADATQIHQVLMNLCVNARDAMPSGGRLTLSAANDHLSEADVQHYAPAVPGPYVRIRVQDTGSGIPASILSQIFDPFFTTKEVGKGTGLGLSTVMGIVKGHAGIITVTSEPGQGTEFQVCLPASVEPLGQDAATEALRAPGGHGELVLIVDDEDSIRQATRELLEANGYRTLLATNGGEAISQFVRHHEAIRIVFTDIMMPVVDGIELARWLREYDPSVKIIATSGLEQQERWSQLAALGVGEVIAKPFTGSELLDAIANKLGLEPHTALR